MALAGHKVGAHTMKKADLVRLVALQQKAEVGALTAKEQERLDALTALLDLQHAGEQPCPFRTDTTHPTCTKPGGVCSLRLYTDEGGEFRPLDGDRGMIRALCPYRFHQGTRRSGTSARGCSGSDTHSGWGGGLPRIHG